LHVPFSVFFESFVQGLLFFINICFVFKPWNFVFHLC
jgi:hypothetical protein